MIQDECQVDWYRVPVDPDKLKELNRRSNLKGLIQAGGYLAIILGTATGTYFAWTYFSWWGLIPAFIIHSNCYAFMINGVHELVHGTVFKTKWLNNLFCGLFAWMGMINHRHFWASHSEHHKFTLNQPCDQEVNLPIRYTFKNAWDSLKPFRFMHLFDSFKGHYKIAFGKIDGDWDKRILEDEKREKYVRDWSLFLFFSHLLLIAVSIAMQWWLLPVLFTFATRGSQIVFFFHNNTQHVGLVDRTTDFRRNCRSFYVNPFSRFLYWQMNYHIEHHMFAGVPCYNLHKLHKEIKKDLPYTFKGIVDCWYNIIGVIYRQQEDPNYEYVAKLPDEEGFDASRPQASEAASVRTIDKNDPIRTHDSGKRKKRIFRIWECGICGFIYNEALGMPEEGIAAGTAWDDIPSDWSCPDCGVSKDDFEMREIAGEVAELAADNNAEKPVVIIGSGLAGYAVARELRRLNGQQDIIIITKDNGEFYPKPQLSTALAAGKDPEELIAKVASDMETELKLTVKANSRAEDIDPQEQTVSVNGESISYHKLVLACGAGPREIPFNGSGAADVLRVNNLDDYRRFRERLKPGASVLIIGAGLIGCEFMNDLNQAGYHVSVCDPMPRALATLVPEEISNGLVDFYRGRGVDFHFNTTVESIGKDGDAYPCTLTNGETVEADLVLAAVGLSANTGLAEAAGLKTGRGIVVDEKLQCSVANIYALGDCIEINGRLLPYIAPINHAAKTLAKTLNGTNENVQFPVMPVQVKTTQYPMVVLGLAHPEKPWEIEETDDGIIARQFNEGQKASAAVLVKDASKQMQDIIRDMAPA
jgi:rubredoxin---NAD+ reductase